MKSTLFLIASILLFLNGCVLTNTNSVIIVDKKDFDEKIQCIGGEKVAGGRSTKDKLTLPELPKISKEEARDRHIVEKKLVENIKELRKVIIDYNKKKIEDE